jgi:nucleoside-diphosphate-sugar epimerase
MTCLVFGCGYLGERVARRWRAAGRRVYVVSRSAARAEHLAAAGYEPLVADVTQPAGWPNWPRADCVLFAIGHDRKAAASQREVYVEGLRGVLHALPPETGTFIYISSTGVYADLAGAWVDENTPPKPQRAGGMAVWEAEQVLLSHPLSRRAVILRMAGLYGAERLPQAELVRKGLPIPADADGWLNLIHVEDATQAVLAAEQFALAHPDRLPRVWLIADGQPCQRREFYRAMAAALAAPEPRFSPPAPGSGAAARSLGNKRVSNRRMLEELRVQLAYPSYKQGVATVPPPNA